MSISLKAFITSIISFIMSQFRPSSDPPPSSPSIDDTEAQPAADATNTHTKMSISSSIKAFFTSIISFIMSQLRAAAAIVEQQNPNQFLLQWENVVMAFCFTSAIQIAALSAQTKSPLSVPFYSLSFVILIVFLLIFVAMSVDHKFTVTSKVLKNIAIFLASTSIILAITIPFPLWLKCTAWVLYALSLFIVFICNKF